MNCPRCTRALVLKGAVSVCAKCGLTVGAGAASPVIEKVIEPEGSLTTLKEEPVQESIEKTVEDQPQVEETVETETVEAETVDTDTAEKTEE